MRDKVSGWVLLDKPEGISSAKALAQVKYLLRAAKAGHAGTLDPMASGLLLIALGEACKFLQLLDFENKSYEFDLVWGQSTTSDDGEGDIVDSTKAIPEQSQIIDHIRTFPSAYDQRPPDFSALKVNGKRAYTLARAGQAVSLKTRHIHLSDFRLISHDHRPTPCSRLSVTLSKGGYVRALGRDLAQYCQSLGYVQHIRRTHIGKLSINDAIPLALLQKTSDTQGHSGREKVLDLASVLDGIPAIEVGDTQKQRLILGQSVPLDNPLDVGANHSEWSQDSRFLLKNRQQVFGIATIQGTTVGGTSIQGAHIKPYRLCAT